MSKRRLVIQSVLSSAFALSVVSAADAAEFLPLCGSSFVTWSDDARTGVSTTSFPAGNVFRDDLFAALSRWNSLRGMSLEFDPIVDDTDGTHVSGNGHNEIVFTDNAGAGGLFAATARRVTTCFFGSDIVEADILFNNEAVPWATGPPDPRVILPTVNFRLTAVHELGHFLGLQHEDDRIAVMMSTAETFWGGSGRFRAAPFPDDAKGARTLYPSDRQETDIAISNFRFVSANNTALILPSDVRTVQPGGTFRTGFGFGNLGTSAVASFEFIVVLSPNAVISTGDRIIASGSGTCLGSCPAGFYGAATFDVSVPADMPPGEYFVGGMLDPQNRLAERREGNNRVAFPGKIRVP